VYENLGGDKKKMKMKMLVLVGIAACVLLLTSPALASAGYSKIYGNANEDDILDMRDVTYIKLVIFGKKPATTFADANYDGKISMLDVGQTKLIILGKEKTLTIVDIGDRTVTVPRPIERVVSCALPCTRVIVALEGCDQLVGSEFSRTPGVPSIGPCIGELAFACDGEILEKVTNVGWGSAVNAELIVSLKPDVIIAGRVANADALQEKTDVPVVTGRYQGYLGGPGFYNQIELIGTVLGKEKEAEELILYMKEKIAEVTDVTSEIPNSKKPRVYFAARDGGRMGGFTKTGYYDAIDLAGGINVAKDCPLFDTYCEFDVSKEQIIAWNPDIILQKCHTSNPPSATQITIEDILEDPLLQTVNAVKNGSVYYCGATARGYPIQRYIPETMYFAKLFHPEKFKDLNLEKEGNEVMERFFKADGLYTWYADETGWLRDFIESQE